MITSRYINGSIKEMQTFLDALGIFPPGGVTLDNEENPTELICKDIADNIVLRYIQGTGSSTKYIRLYTNGGAEEIVQNIGNGNPTYGYACSSGGVILFGTALVPYFLIVTRTNSGEIACIVSVSSASGVGTTIGVKEVTYDGVAPVSESKLNINVKNQVSITPFCVNGAIGETAYTPNAYFVPYTNKPYNGSAFEEIELNGEHFLFNGVIAMKDEGDAV